MHNLSRRSFLRVAGGRTTVAAAAVVPLMPGSIAAPSVGDQTLKKIAQHRPLPNANPIWLPIDPTNKPQGIFTVIYSVQMVNLLVGDTLQVLAEVQGTNHTAEAPINNGQNIQLGTWVSLATSATHTTLQANESYICNPSGANIVSLPAAPPTTPNNNIGNHYGVPTRVGAITIPTARTWFVNVIVYGLCDAFPGLRNDLLSTLPGYGQLTVMLFR